jgi:hypothetical protein
LKYIKKYIYKEVDFKKAQFIIQRAELQSFIFVDSTGTILLKVFSKLEAFEVPAEFYDS